MKYDSLLFQYNSLLFQYMVRALKADPTWTVEMYCIYNDIGPKITKELRQMYNEWLREEDEVKP